jgi:hypothetical protein
MRYVLIIKALETLPTIIIFCIDNYNSWCHRKLTLPYCCDVRHEYQMLTQDGVQYSMDKLIHQFGPITEMNLPITMTVVLDKNNIVSMKTTSQYVNSRVLLHISKSRKKLLPVNNCLYESIIVIHMKYSSMLSGPSETLYGLGVIYADVFVTSKSMY